MKRDKLKTNVLFSKLFISLALFLFIAIFARLAYLSLATEIDGMNLKKFSASLKTIETTVKASRGQIFDSNANILAQNISSYTVIAYLSEKREKEDYVHDLKETAKQLSPLIDMTEESILKLLNKKAYQVELGPGGRNISQTLKDKIYALNLPGIGFTQSTKRYYPNGNYASYIIGYSKENSKEIDTGEMGIEKYFNDYLTGKDGFFSFQADLTRTKIANTKEIIEKAIDGDDVYLTIDTNIQLFVEQTVKQLQTDSNPEWATIVIADAKTGAILGSSSVPSFDPNIKNITNYLNPLTSIEYEPGSTMKIFTYMAALEGGKYDGNKTYQTGSIKFGDDTINDWNVKGWGTINYDQGFALSSNVGVSTMFKTNVVTKTELKDYFAKLGFGKITNITLPNEVKGKINFKYDIETANATFGQGITTTAIQNVQALTAVSNDGVLLAPYIVEKIVDNKNNIIFQGGKEELGRVASEATIIKIKSLMKNVMAGDLQNSTGSRYNVPQYDMIGKTGTAQIPDNIRGGYLKGTNDYTRVFSGIFPADDPQVIIYAAAKKGYNVVTTLPVAVKSLTESVGKYLGINQDETNNVENVSFKLPSYINKNVGEVNKQLATHNIKPIIIGNGTKVINQAPNQNTLITYLDKVILITNSSEISAPNLTGWSRKDFLTFAKLSNIKYEITGTGYITSQNIETGTVIKPTDVLKVTLTSAITN